MILYQSTIDTPNNYYKQKSLQTDQEISLVK